MRSRGLKIRLLSVAIAAGIAIAATLFLLEYLDYRKSSDVLVKQGERSLLNAEAQRLDLLASDMAAASAQAIEGAVRDDDKRTLEKVVASLLNNPYSISARVVAPDGSVVYETIRQDQWTQQITDRDKRTIRRGLGGVESLGTLEIVVGRPGLADTAHALKTQLERVQRVA